MNENPSTLSGVVAEHIAAVNAFDEEAIVATFAADALVNDAHREFWGTDAIRDWVAKEMVGDHVTHRGRPRSSTITARWLFVDATTVTTTRPTSPMS